MTNILRVYNDSSNLTNRYKYVADIKNNLSSNNFSTYLSDIKVNKTFDLKSKSIDNIYNNYNKNMLGIGDSQKIKVSANNWIHENSPVITQNFSLSLPATPNTYPHSNYFELRDATGKLYDAVEADSICFLMDDNSGKLFMIERPSNESSISCGSITYVNEELEKALCEFFGIEELPIESMSEKFPTMSSWIHTDEASGITYIWEEDKSQGQGILYTSKEQIKYMEDLAQKYEAQYPNFMKNSSSKIFAYMELRGECRRTPIGILSYGGCSIRFSNEKDFTKSWKIEFESGVNVKELFAENGIYLDKINQFDFQFWQDLLQKDIRYKDISSKITYAGKEEYEYVYERDKVWNPPS